MKWRNSKERELLASGGSRDQTLPNKNNPNPDLSDARTDRAPSMSPTSQPASPGSEPPPAQTLEPFTSPSSVSNSAKSSDSRKSSLNMGAEGNGKSEKLFKLEYEDSRQPATQQQQQQIFSNFYEKVRDMNASMAFTGRSGDSGNANNPNASNGANNLPNFYYDEYDSNSDSDEEISVT